MEKAAKFLMNINSFHIPFYLTCLFLLFINRNVTGFAKTALLHVVFLDQPF
jgi:hypothetical protein